jgi:hypothetical protein
VPPLRDAVGLVDDEQADVHVAQRVEEAGRGEAFRGDVEQLDLARHGPGDRRAIGDRALLGVDERRPARDGALEALDLVLHERHERRDDDRQVRAHERGQLVAERFARPGGHHHQEVTPGERGADRLRLPGPERGEAEVFAQGGEGGIHAAADLTAGGGGRPRSRVTRREGGTATARTARRPSPTAVRERLSAEGHNQDSGDRGSFLTRSQRHGAGRGDGGPDPGADNVHGGLATGAHGWATSASPVAVRREAPAGTLGGGPAGADMPGRAAYETARRRPRRATGEAR